MYRICDTVFLSIQICDRHITVDVGIVKMFIVKIVKVNREKHN